MLTPHNDHSDESGIAINPHDLTQIPASVTPAQLRLATLHDGAQDKFPIVGLGGSAGSLQAFESFFENMPPTAAWPSW